MHRNEVVAGDVIEWAEGYADISEVIEDEATNGTGCVLDHVGVTLWYYSDESVPVPEGGAIPRF